MTDFTHHKFHSITKVSSSNMEALKMAPQDSNLTVMGNLSIKPEINLAKLATYLLGDIHCSDQTHSGIVFFFPCMVYDPRERFSPVDIKFQYLTANSLSWAELGRQSFFSKDPK